MSRQIPTGSGGWWHEQTHDPRPPNMQNFPLPMGHQLSPLMDQYGKGHLIHKDKLGGLGQLLSWVGFFSEVVRIVGGLAFIASCMVLIMSTWSFSLAESEMEWIGPWLIYALIGVAASLVFFAFRDGPVAAVKGLYGLTGLLLGVALVGLGVTYIAEGPSVAQGVLEIPFIQGLLTISVLLALPFLGVILRAIVIGLRALGYAILCFTWLWVPVVIFVLLNNYCASR